MDKYGNMILRLAYTYLKSRADAEDVLQDVFVRVYEKNPEFDSDEHTRAWLVRTTVNLCKNRLGSFWSRNRRPIEDAENAAVFDSYNEGSSVIDAVFTLGKKYRVCVFLFYFEGYSTAETAPACRQKRNGGALDFAPRKAAAAGDFKGGLRF